MKQRITLYAEDGMVLTDGEHYGRTVHLAVDADASAWHQITKEEYDAIMEDEMLGEMSEQNATEEDYKQALSEFGVKA